MLRILPRIRYVGGLYVNALTFHILGPSVVLHCCVCLPGLGINIIKYYIATMVPRAHSHTKTNFAVAWSTRFENWIWVRDTKCFTEHARIVLECSFNCVEICNERWDCWLLTVASDLRTYVRTYVWCNCRKKIDQAVDALASYPRFLVDSLDTRLQTIWPRKDC